MSSPRWAYTAPDGPHGHWQITDEHGAIHACPHQPPSDELLAALLSPPATADDLDTTAAPATPATAPAAAPRAGIGRHRPSPAAMIPPTGLRRPAGTGCRPAARSRCCRRCGR